MLPTVDPRRCGGVGVVGLIVGFGVCLDTVVIVVGVLITAGVGAILIVLVDLVAGLLVDDLASAIEPKMKMTNKLATIQDRLKAFQK